MTQPPQSPAENYTSEALGAVLAQLTRDQLRFVVAMQECATKGEAAAAIGLKPSTIYHWPPIVDTALILLAQDVAATARAINQRMLLKAMLVKVAGLDSADEAIRQRTATELIEWQLGKAVQKVAQTDVAGQDVPLPDPAERAARIVALLAAAAERAVGGTTP